MKTIKYISILVLSACMAALSSCTEEDIVKKGTPGDGHTLKIELTADANRVVSPLSKASAEDPSERVTDLNILIYQDGTLVQNESEYVMSGDILTELSQPSTTGNNASAPFTLTDIEPGAKMVYVVANAGASLINNSEVATETGLKAYRLGLNGLNPQFVMFAEGQSFDVSGNASITSSLKRIYSMVTVKMDLSTLNKDVQIIPQSVQLKNIPLTGRLSDLGGTLEQGNKVTANDGSESKDGEMLKRGSNESFLTVDHSSATPLFLYENRQQQGKNNGDERTKTPWYFSDEAISMPEIIKTDKMCSYIEIQAKCIKDNDANGAGSGDVTYRFFLGKDAAKSFDVARNWYYKVTLKLTGNGGVDEGTWRVEADLLEELTIPKVYISYNAGSKSYTAANGDFKNARVSPKDNNKIAVELDRQTGQVTITAKETNTSDYASRTFEYDYYVDGKYKGTAEVVQVPRLVDPIAIYRKAKSTQPFDVNVRKYDDKAKAYNLLVSDGPWSAQIESFYPSGESCWFDIYPPEGNSSIVETNGIVTGTGAVNFGYKPLSENKKTDRVSSGKLNDFAGEQTDGARYGVILVKYHNNQCEHRIYVRQGYQPTTIEGTVWSMFNCLGKQSNGSQGYTEYPTQTGWLFHGGSDIAMHPCNPGYEVQPSSKGVLCSDNKYRTFGIGFSANVDNWVNGGSRSSNAKQGPCPTGYKLVNDTQLDNLCQSKGSVITTTGFVYDDDPVQGWRYVGKNMVAETDNNSSNPAKGTLFVQKSNGASVFFTHGKGVLTEHQDNNLIDEIGIGHRSRWTDGYQNSHKNTVNGVLKYWEYTDADYGELSKKEHTYGAFYWAAAKFNDTRLSRVCLSYNILTQDAYYVDMVGNKNHQGIHVTHHGNFVRCVRTTK